MKRRTKLILLVAVLGCLGGIGVVLSKIVREAGVPFPGAVVVLDDASWKARYKENQYDTGYLWANSTTILYYQKVEGKYQEIRRRILPDRTVSAPETLPIVIGEKDYTDSLSPDGTILCRGTPSTSSTDSYWLIRTDGTEKPVHFRSYAYHWYWSPDSRSLYGTDDSNTSPCIVRIDAKTGAVTTTTLDTKEDFYLETITPEGKLLSLYFNRNLQSGQKFVQWKIKEARGKQVVTTTYQKRSNSPSPDPNLSPNGTRILWRLIEKENSSLDVVLLKLFRKTFPSHRIVRYLVTDIDGKNERMIGMLSEDRQRENELIAKWTPDGKGIHFLEKGKLMYLAVP